MSRESIALNPVVRPKNGAQFMAPRIPYWKTPAYKKAKAEEATTGKHANI